MKQQKFIALLIVFMLVLSACAGPAQSNDGNKETTAKVTEKASEAATTAAQEATTEAASTEPKHVKNLVIGTLSKNEMFSAVTSKGIFGGMNYNGFTQGNFVYRDQDGTLKPYFFRSFEISEDGKEFHFTFPTDAVWHDGKPVTADDIVFTFDYMKNVKKSGYLKELEECVIESENSGKLVFSAPVAYYWINATFTGRVLPKHIWENITDYREYSEPDAAIGCGPYKLVKVDRESQTSYYEAVPQNNYAGDVTVDKVTCQTYADKSALLMALTSGEIDALYDYATPIDAHLIDPLIGVPDIDLGQSDYAGNYQMTYGMEKQPCEDVNVRKAIRLALNYDKLAKLINGDYGKAPGVGIIPPTAKGHDASLPMLKMDLDAANKMLDEAGYVDKDGDGFRDYPDGSVLDIKVTPQYSSKKGEILKRIAETVMASLKEVNIKTHIDQESLRSSEIWEKNIEDGNYDLAIGYTTSGYAYYFSSFRYFLGDPRFPGEKTWMWGTFHNDEYHDAYFSMVQASSDEEYNKYSSKMQKMAEEYCYGQAMCWEQAFFPYRTDKYQGWINFPGWGVINAKTFFNLTEK